MANEPENAESSKDESSDSSKPFASFKKEIKAAALNNPGYIQLNFFTLFWLFVAGSVFGLVVETIYHAIVFGGLESRAGLVWGPFSPIYGVGAVVLTFFLNRYYYSHNLVIFLIAMVLGSVIEYGASWVMEVFWGTIAWDYTGTFGSIQGRTNFFFGMMWGMLGLVWVRLMLPLVKRVFTLIDSRNKVLRLITIVFTIFLSIDVICTCLAFDRQKDRSNGIPPSNYIEEICDQAFPDSFMESHFENMSLR
ncbi:MAG: putative ABC transporter permease [Raoultibacter sp.]|jgi:uncharacterized membrane protein